jgi:hypothetical protein
MRRERVVHAPPRRTFFVVTLDSGSHINARCQSWPARAQALPLAQFATGPCLRIILVPLDTLVKFTERDKIGAALLD